MGDYFSVADITAMVTIDFARWVKQKIPEDCAHLKRWYELVSSRPSARRLMTGYFYMKNFSGVLLCGLLAASPANADSSVTLYSGAPIWTANPEQPWASALVVDGERIVAVGEKDALLTEYPDAARQKLPGDLVVPGLIDNHTHFMDGSEELLSVDTYNARDKADFIQRIADFAAQSEPGAWIIGGIWDHESWGGELPRRQWIDAHTPDNPVFLLRTDGHMAIANSRAIELAGINDDTPDPEGGTMVRDRQTGSLTGVLKDNAMNFVFDVIPARTPAERDRIFDAGMEEAASHGVTQIHNMGRWEDLPLFRQAQEQGRLRVRTVFYPPLGKRRELAALIDSEGAGDDWLNWNGVKALTDGSLGSTTAWFYEPYTDEPHTNGFPLKPFEQLEPEIAEAHELGLKLAIHAIGDQSNDLLLDIFERLGPFQVAPRIEHAQHLTAEAIRRIGELGIVASMQPYHAIDDGRWAENRIGAERLKGTYAFRSLIDAGVTLSFGSDWSVAPLDPIAGIYAAVTRRTLDGRNPNGWVPEQKITLDQALAAYTINNARAAGMAAELGSLEPGKYADFVVLSKNLFDLAPQRIRESEVRLTVIGGKEAYRQ